MHRLFACATFEFPALYLVHETLRCDGPVRLLQRSDRCVQFLLLLGHPCYLPPLRFLNSGIGMEVYLTIGEAHTFVQCTSACGSLESFGCFSFHTWYKWRGCGTNQGRWRCMAQASIVAQHPLESLLGQSSRSPLTSSSWGDPGCACGFGRCKFGLLR